MAKPHHDIYLSFGQTNTIGELKPVKCLIIMLLDESINHPKYACFFLFALYVTFCIFLIVHLMLNVLFSGFYFASFIITKILNEFFL